MTPPLRPQGEGCICPLCRRQDEAYSRGYSDSENGLPRNCPWYDRTNRKLYRDGYNAAKRARTPDTLSEEPGRFGHHPDPATDWECEIDALIGMAYERLTMSGHPDLEERISKAMQFRTMASKGHLRWLSQTFCGTREIYATKPDWVQWPEDKLATLSEGGER